MSSTFFGFFDKVFIALLGKVYIVVLCKCGTKCRGKGLFRKFSPPPTSQRGPLGGYTGNFVVKVAPLSPLRRQLASRGRRPLHTINEVRVKRADASISPYRMSGVRGTAYRKILALLSCRLYTGIIIMYGWSTAMMKIYRTQDKQLTRVDEIGEGCWVCLNSPDENEARLVASTLDIEPADLMAATDPEESARISLEDGYTLIIVDIPIKVPDSGEGIYTTIPLGIILTQELIVTVCSVDTPVIGDFTACRVKGFSTRKKMRFVYQLLYRAASMYQQELRLIDRRRQAIEKNLSGDLKDSDLMELHGLESTLVYFATSLRANATVLDRLTRYKRLEQYPDDRELLDDVIVEIRQAIEMTSIYRDDIKGTRELFSSILDNRLNNAMKYLTSITLLMAVPTVISGLYGMNVQADGMPFANSTAGFAIVLGLTLALCILSAWVLHKKHML